MEDIKNIDKGYTLEEIKKYSEQGYTKQEIITAILDRAKSKGLNIAYVRTNLYNDSEARKILDVEGTKNNNDGHNGVISGAPPFMDDQSMGR